MIDLEAVVHNWAVNATRRKACLFCCACLRCDLNVNGSVRDALGVVADVLGRGGSGVQAYRRVAGVRRSWQGFEGFVKGAALAGRLINGVGWESHLSGGLPHAELALECVREVAGLSPSLRKGRPGGLVLDILDEIGGPTLFERVPPEVFKRDGGLLRRTAWGVARSGDWAVLPALADLLQDLGYSDSFFLDHLTSGRPHLPGCWALDHLSGIL